MFDWSRYILKDNSTYKVYLASAQTQNTFCAIHLSTCETKERPIGCCGPCERETCSKAAEIKREWKVGVSQFVGIYDSCSDRVNYKLNCCLFT